MVIWLCLLHKIIVYDYDKRNSRYYREGRVAFLTSKLVESGPFIIKNQVGHGQGQEYKFQFEQKAYSNEKKSSGEDTIERIREKRNK